MMISLPHDNGRSFNLSLLLRYLVLVGRPYIIQGQQRVAFGLHTKESSLDYWIRANIAQNQDTAQATNDVVDQVCATGLFRRSNDIVCPDSGHPCNGIELVV